MSWARARLARNKAACLELRNRWYPESEWPGEIYLAEIRANPGDALLEIGCGRRAEMLRRADGCFNRRVGLDPELSGVEPHDTSIELVAGDAAHLPFENESFDVVAMQNVAEHFEHPGAVLRECARVLRRSGKVIIQTVNKRFPLITLARWMPHWMRVPLNGVLSGTAHEDTFPTYYRANTPGALRMFAAEAGLTPVRLDYLSHHPTYFLFSTWFYRLAVLIERPVRRIPALAPLRHFLHVVLEKPDGRGGDRAPCAG